MASTTQIYTLSLHDALPISRRQSHEAQERRIDRRFHRVLRRDEDGSLNEGNGSDRSATEKSDARSEEHTSELQSPDHLVCRLLLEKKKQIHIRTTQFEHHDI